MLFMWQGYALGYNFAPHGLEPSTKMVRANFVLSGRDPNIATVHIDHDKVRHEPSIYMPSSEDEVQAAVSPCC